jgi:hypothetical protein
MHSCIRVVRKNAWLIGAAIAFALSFVFSRYFLQFLILTLLLGIKWIASSGGSKNVIMIYEALRHREKESDGNQREQTRRF